MFNLQAAINVANEAIARQIARTNYRALVESPEWAPLVERMERELESVGYHSRESLAAWRERVERMLLNQGTTRESVGAQLRESGALDDCPEDATERVIGSVWRSALDAASTESQERAHVYVMTLVDAKRQARALSLVQNARKIAEEFEKLVASRQPLE